MNTLLGYRTRVRAFLDETTATFWTDAQVNQWVNDALEDIYSRLQIVQSISSSIGTVAGTQSYALPGDLILLTRVESAVAGVTTPLFAISSRDADNRFGSGSQGAPQFYRTFGTPGQTTGADRLQIFLYPTPNANGNLNLYYERMPTILALDTDSSEIPPGWDRLIPWYAAGWAATKDRDFTLANFMFNRYDSLVAEMSTDTRKQTNDTEYSDGQRRLVGGLHQLDTVRSPQDSRGK